MKLFLLSLSIFLLVGCNLAQWNQNRLTRRFEWKDVHEKVFQSKGRNIHYFEGGEGDTVLLIHGFGGDAQMIWNKTIRDLARDYHVIAPDLLWFGQSDSDFAPSLKTQVDGMFALLKDRKVTKCSVVGISYGGFVTLGMVYENKAIFDKVCFVDSPGTTYDLSLLDELCARQGVESVEDIFVAKNQQDVRELFQLAFYKKRLIPKAVLEDIYELYFSKNHEELALMLQTLPAQERLFQNTDIGKVPETKVIWGANDEIFPVSEGRKFADFMDADFVEIPKSGHAPNIENFKVFEAELREFLED